MTDTEDRIEEEHVNEVLKSRVRRLWFLTVGTPIIILVLALIIYSAISITSSVKTFASSHSNVVMYAGLALLGLCFLFMIFKKIYKWFKSSNEEVTTQKKKVLPNPVPTEGDELVRWVYCITFHTLVAYLGWMFLDYYLYTPLGTGFLSWMIQITSYSILGWSFVNTFDRKTIQPNFAAEMYYVGKPVFSNVSPGFTCLGLPKWLTTVQVVDFKQIAITIGLMKGDKREPLVIESDLFAAIFDVMFRVQPNNTAKILALKEPPEKILVSIMNSVLFRFANMVKIDKDGKVVTEEILVREKEGEEAKKVTKELKRFPTINSLKAATAQLAQDIMNEENTEQYEQCARFKMQEVGFYLLDVTLKDVENPDKEILTAAQKLAAKALYEEAEMLSTENTLQKVMYLFNGLNFIGKPNELTGEDMIPMSECVRIVEREEGTRTTNEVTSGTNGGGKKGKNNQSQANPAILLDARGGKNNNPGD